MPSARGNQALRNDEAEALRRRMRTAFWSLERECADDALDGFRRVDGVQRGINQVAGFGRFERHFDRFAVAHFADQNQFRRLPQRGAQSQGEARRVAVQLALMNGGALVRMQELDGVLDGDDVAGFFLVDLVDKRGERRGFAAARSAR